MPALHASALTPPPGNARRRRGRLRPAWRRAAWWALLAAALLHVGISLLARDVLSLLDPSSTSMQRMRAAFTRTITLSEPPAGAAASRTPTPNLTGAAAAQAAESAASAAARKASQKQAAQRQRARAAALAAQRLAARAEHARRLAEAQAAAASATAGVGSESLPPLSPLTEAPKLPSSTDSPTRAPLPAPVPDTATAVAPASAPMPAPTPLSASAAASAPVLASASSSPDGSGPAFSWPASTRINYRLTGWYNGEVHGSAQVEWLREGDRYQVHLEVFIGPRFAPLVTRRMSSEGLITPAGLSPRRYEQETRQILRDKRLAVVSFDNQAITLARGERVPTMPDVQDTASQFIQLIYLFSTQPVLRTAGRTVEIGLALPNRVDRWTYDVGPTATLPTPAGDYEAFHVKPQRAAAKGDLSIEIWFAQRLAMMPVRIRIRQDADTYADLLIDRAPEQSDPTAPLNTPPTSPPRSSP